MLKPVLPQMDKAPSPAPLASLAPPPPLARSSDAVLAPTDAQLRAKKLIKGTLRRLTFSRMRRVKRRQRALAKALKLVEAFPRHPNPKPHGLPGKLVISLTSYPARYPTLHMTIKSLLDQTVKADLIVLWVAHEHAAELPQDLLSLQNERFRIRTWEDIRNFKKIIPTLITYPGSFTVITDDDTYYPDHWLEQLVEGYDPGNPTIVCHRAHRLTYAPDGKLAPYRRWHRAVRKRYTLRPRTDILPTGNGGVLYPPGSLPPIATDMELIRKLSPTSDDVWLYFMWRHAGWTARRVKSRIRKFTEWPDSQGTSLRAFHLGGKKDEHLQDMSEYFGVP